MRVAQTAQAAKRCRNFRSLPRSFAGRLMRVLYMTCLLAVCGVPVPRLTGILAQAPNPIQLLDRIASITGIYQDSSR